ncbi:MAG: family 16 glycosylhydrolase [Candidatus Omnitrophica bacterium]|nr:family 16 glycosylhydrolase [Candidatus Omnitrophota bacterium]
MAVIFLELMSCKEVCFGFKSGELISEEAYKYGRFEVRMKSARGSGLVSSFFTFNDHAADNIQWWNEIDIELLGKYEDIAHFNIIKYYAEQFPYVQSVSFDPHADFHVYSFEWTPDGVRWFIDGVLVFTDYYYYAKQLTEYQKIMMNLWMSTDVWQEIDPGNLIVDNPNILPVYAYYDWVKYYSYNGQTGTFSLEWVEDFNTAAEVLTRWNPSEKAGFWGSNSDFEPENVFFHKDGYLVLICDDLPDDIIPGIPGPDEIILANPQELEFTAGAGNRKSFIIENAVEQSNVYWSASTNKMFWITGIYPIQGGPISLHQTYPVTMWINRQGLSDGLHEGIITFTGGGKKTNVLVKVWIQGGGSLKSIRSFPSISYYDDLGSAYFNSLDNAIIQTKSEYFGKDFIADQNKVVRLSGGYDAFYDVNANGNSILKSMKVLNGKIIIESGKYIVGLPK